jgi:hypothetical protein
MFSELPLYTMHERTPAKLDNYIGKHLLSTGKNKLHLSMIDFL